MPVCDRSDAGVPLGRAAWKRRWRVSRRHPRTRRLGIDLCRNAWPVSTMVTAGRSSRTPGPAWGRSPRGGSRRVGSWPADYVEAGGGRFRHQVVIDPIVETCVGRRIDAQGVRTDPRRDVVDNLERFRSVLDDGGRGEPGLGEIEVEPRPDEPAALQQNSSTLGAMSRGRSCRTRVLRRGSSRAPLPGSAAASAVASCFGTQNVACAATGHQGDFGWKSPARGCRSDESAGRRIRTWPRAVTRANRRRVRGLRCVER